MPEEKGRVNAIIKLVRHWGSLSLVPGRALINILRGGKK